VGQGRTGKETRHRKATPQHFTQSVHQNGMRNSQNAKGPVPQIHGLARALCFVSGSRAGPQAISELGRLPGSLTPMTG
jgi:hypothetical protein